MKLNHHNSMRNSFGKWVCFVFVVCCFLKGVNAQTKDSFQLVITKRYASCQDYALQGEGGKKIELPQSIQDALTCPVFIGLNQHQLVFLQKEEIKLYNLETKKEKSLMPVRDSLLKESGISPPVWSLNGKRMAFVLPHVKRSMGPSTPSSILAYVIVMTFANNDQVKIQTFDRPVNFVCGSICSSTPNEDYGFKDNDTFWYKRHWANPKRPNAIDEIKELS